MSYLPMAHFINVLERSCQAKVKALIPTLHTVEYGMLSVGIKLHDLSGGAYLMPLIEALGGSENVVEMNLYRREGAVCLVLPAFGSAKAAIEFIECIELAIDKPLFRNPRIQIQVCSPGRLSNTDAGFLTLAFYLGSDVIRSYNLDDFETTFTSNSAIPRGKRITLYDGRGELDNGFEWWSRLGEYRHVQTKLPFTYERTDVLTCTTRKDVYNVNLAATLLVHATHDAYWARLGVEFRNELQALLHEHMLDELLLTQWIIPDREKEQEDDHYKASLRELRNYVVDEVRRLHAVGRHSGILHNMNQMLESYRKRLIFSAEVLTTGERS